MEKFFAKFPTELLKRLQAVCSEGWCDDAEATHALSSEFASSDICGWLEPLVGTESRLKRYGVAVACKTETPRKALCCLYALRSVADSMNGRGLVAAVATFKAVGA
jgi:hypothetical protein